MNRRLFAGAALFVLCSGGAQSDPLAARSKGRADAPVTVYEMSDFQCPYCREFALGTMPLLEREYIATGKARLVYINLPLASVHKNATVAAEIAVCAARQGHFWPMHDLLFRHQDQWAGLAAPQAYLLALGDSAGLDRAQLTRCVASRASAADVQVDAGRAQRAGATSTPTFYIEGGLLEGAAPVTVFRAVLDSIYRSKTTQRPR
ncbi:MAG TPA: thioredoxin domain-containing protein [Gemmatimonadales bacterium]|nr:thioredoxin domain-containing protein [Gemmatimonadales bacterium]